MSGVAVRTCVKINLNLGEVSVSIWAKIPVESALLESEWSCERFDVVTITCTKVPQNLSESSIKTCTSSIWGNFPLDSAWFKRWSAKISLEIHTDIQRKAARKPAESLVQSAVSFRCSFYGPGWFFCHILSLFDNIYISNSLMVQLSIVFCVELYIQPEEQRQRVSECLRPCVFSHFSFIGSIRPKPFWTKPDQGKFPCQKLLYFQFQLLSFYTLVLHCVVR